MARNGSGTYNRPVAPYVYDTTISETAVNSEMDQMATALTDSIAKDGQTVPTAHLPMGGYRHTDVAAASTQTDYVRVDQVQKNTLNYLTSVGGTADAITATAALGPIALTAGMRFSFIPAGDNTTTTPTININSIGAITFTRDGGDAVVASDILMERPCEFLYNGTNAEVLNPASVMAGGVTTAALADSAVTLAKMANMATASLLGRATAGTGVPEVIGLDSTLAMAAGSLKVVAASTSQAGAVEKSTSAEVVAETADKYPDAALLKYHPGVAKAYVNFNGTGTVAIRESHNVSSITDTGTGAYTINFTANMANASYAPFASAVDRLTVIKVLNVAYVSMVVADFAGTAQDSSTVSVSVFGALA